MGQSNTITAPSQLWRTITYALLFVLAAAKLGVMLWSTNKGFDLGDEGLYMLSLSDPEHYKVLAHGYFLNKVLLIGEFTIPISRIISICLELAGGIVFSWGVYRWLASRLSGVSFWAIWALVLIGSFQSILARCVSYNDLINFLGLTSAGVLLASFSFESVKKQTLLWVLSAFLLTFCTLFKAPVTISLSILYFGMAIFYGPGKKLPKLAKAAAAWVVGAALTMIAYTILYNGLGWTDVISHVKATADLLNYRPIDLVLMYVIYDGTPNLVFIGLGIGIYWLCYTMIKSVAPNRTLLAFLFSGAISTAVCYGAIIGLKQLLIREEQPVYFYLWVVINVLIVLVYNAYKQIAPQVRKEVFILMLFLIALPFAMIGGTNGFITETLFAFWIPWFGLAAICLQWLASVGFSAVKYYVLLGATVLATSMQFHYSKVLRPFGVPNNQSIWDQTTLLAGKDNLMLSPDLVEYFQSFQAALDAKNVKPNTPIVAFNYMPGLVYLAQGYSPGAPFYLYGNDFVRYNCHFLKTAGETIQQPPIILYRTSTFAFPRHFTCIKKGIWHNIKGYSEQTIFDPYDAVYEHEDYNNDSLYIWIPNQTN